MVGKKSMGRISPALLVLLSLGCAFATYNLITMVRRYQANGGERELAEFESVARLADPVVRMSYNSKKVMVFKRRFHVVLTATDASYSKWQCRIMYYWYKKTNELEGLEMGGFTRVLHSGKSDDLMDEIPTFVVDPLPSGLDRGTGEGKYTRKAVSGFKPMISPPQGSPFLVTVREILFETGRPTLPYDKKALTGMKACVT